MANLWIGVTPQYDYEQEYLRVDPRYFHAVQACGGTPVLLPLTADPGEIAALAERFDGFLFTGGPDPLPALYGEQTLRCCGRIDHRRDALELPLLRKVLGRGKPVLGICRGVQVLNVALGGSLWQDLPAQCPESLLHSQQRPFDACTHRVAVAPGTLLHTLVGQNELAVNTLHHQAVKAVAPGLVAAAHSADGVIEALCGPEGRFVLGVQWHPEWLFAAQEPARAIFAGFLEACRAAAL